MSQIDEFSSLTSVSEALKGAIDPAVAAKALGPGRLAQRAWFSVNGDVERAHTCGTYLAKPRRAGEPPVFVVYTDTRTRAVDFSANKEVYLARMAAAGFAFSDMRFLQTKNPPKKKTAEGHVSASSAPAPVPLPPLSPSEEQEVAQAVSSLPAGLREKVQKAMSASLRREKADSSRNGA